MKKTKRREHDCPFRDTKLQPWDDYDNLCGACTAKNRHQCFFPYKYPKDNRYWITECRTIQRVRRAFQNKEYAVLQYFWGKIYDQENWKSFVEEITDRDWKKWQLEIGKMLMARCKKDDSCPFKPLLP